MATTPGISLRFISPFLFLAVFFFSTAVPADDIEPTMENIVANYIIIDVEGAANVHILKEGQTQWQEARIGTRLEEGDKISVGDDTEVVLSLKSETTIHLDKDTQLSVSQLSDNQANGFLSRLKLLGGALLSDVKKHLADSGSQFEVQAGGVVCGVRGTVFEVSTNGKSVQTSTDEGEVEVKSSQGTQRCTAGHTCSTSPGGVSHVRPCSSQTRGRFQNWHQVHQQLHERENTLGKPGTQMPPGVGFKPLGIRLGHNPANPLNHVPGSSKGSTSAPSSHAMGRGHR